MEASEIFSIIAALCVVVTEIVVYYFKIKGNIIETVSGLIAKAEQTGYEGVKKMDIVVDILYEKVPTGLRTMITKEFIRNIAQKIFDDMRNYALEYINSKIEVIQIKNNLESSNG